MFSLLSMSPISDWLAPDLSPLEEFKAQYEMFISYFTQQRENGIEITKCHIESTNLTMILTKMCNLLIFEQAEIVDPTSADSISTSIEYFLQNDIANILAVYAQADTPLGLCPIILLFFNKLIIDCKMDLMPHVCFHSAVNKLVSICGRIPAGPYEIYEIIFLRTLIDFLVHNPEYINFFSHNDAYPLMDSLLSLLQSPDSDISTQTGDCILKLLHSSDDRSLRLVLERTPFSEIVINKVIQHYNEIPRNLNPNEIEISLTAIQFDQSVVNTTFTNAIRKFLSFLKWFLFYDSIIERTKTKPDFQSRILNKLRIEFLEAFILSDLLGHGFDSYEDSIDNCFLTTVILLNCLKTSQSYDLFRCISDMLTMTKAENYIPYHPNVAKSLLLRCDLQSIYNNKDYSEEFKQKQYKLTCATYQLFEKVLSKPFKSIIQKLILNDLYREGADSSQTQEAKELKPELNDSYIDRFLSQKLSNDIECRRHSLKLDHDYQFAKNDKLCAILYYYDSLVPNEFRLGSHSDYDDYAKEALKAYDSYFRSVPSQNFHRISHSLQNESQNSTDKDNEETLNFVDIVLNCLQFIPRLPYEIGVQIFACLAKMAMILDPRIDNKLLDSTIHDLSRMTLFNCLYKLISELQVSVSGIDNLNNKLIIIKKILLGEVKKKAEYNGSVEEQQILQSIIVVDEFCKEIAAIALVKQKLFI